MNRKVWVLGGVLLLALVPALCLTPDPAAAESTVTTQEIEEGLTCQCGCGLTVHSCNHLTCGSAIPLRREVRTLVDGGFSRDEILNRFQEKYGEKILAAPTTKGFNLTAWVLPFVMLGIGSLVVFATVRRWSSGPAGADPVPASPLSPEERERVERELRDQKV